MKKFGIVMMTLMFFGLISVEAAMAGRVGNRQIRQQKRIHQGIHSGELTGREVRALQREQRHVQRSKRRAWSDGELTPGERIRLEHKQDRASRHIYRFKHNEIDR
jgi:hypothetical protein